MELQPDSSKFEFQRLISLGTPMSPSTPTANVQTQPTIDHLALLQEQVDFEQQLSDFIQAPPQARRAQTVELVLEMVSL
jgi:hypothetical protein